MIRFDVKSAVDVRSLFLSTNCSAQTCYSSGWQERRSCTDNAHDIDILRTTLVKEPLYFKEYSSCHFDALKNQVARAETNPLQLSRIRDIQELVNAFPDVVRVSEMMREVNNFQI